MKKSPRGEEEGNTPEAMLSTPGLIAMEMTNLWPLRLNSIITEVQAA